MVCKTVPLDNGFAIVCSRPGPTKPRKCSVCGAPAGKLCDFVFQRPVIRNGMQKLEHFTCDKPLCARCAVRKAANVDWCPDHTPPEAA